MEADVFGRASNSRHSLVAGSSLCRAEVSWDFPGHFSMPIVFGHGFLRLLIVPAFLRHLIENLSSGTYLASQSVNIPVLITGTSNWSPDREH